MPTEDYFSSALRHYEDSRRLGRRLAAARSENAAYLGGYVIECGLKRVLELHGHSARSYGHNLKVMHGKALALASLLAPGVLRYRIDGIPGIVEACAKWRPEMRYWKTGTLTTDQFESLEKARDEIFQRVLVPLILDGREARVT